MTPIYVVIALIGGGAIAAVALDRRRCRAATEPIPLWHPAMQPTLRKFRTGQMDTPENTGLDPWEESVWEAITKAEQAASIAQAVKGRQDGERA